ncbi:MAG TPA: hypothetical protein VMU80_03945 [Bryobacteraceae bacterium]|nr:hypothetical protein [Bryobacteraceae bacterium]
MPQKLTAEIIHAAIEGFESQKRRIDAQIDELRQLLKGDRAAETPATGLARPRRKMSASARKRIAAAQKARWAKVKAEGAASPQSKPKRKLSAAGRKAISEAAKKRWAAKRGQS